MLVGRASPTCHLLVVRPGNVLRDGQVQVMARIAADGEGPVLLPKFKGFRKAWAASAIPPHKSNLPPLASRRSLLALNETRAGNGITAAECGPELLLLWRVARRARWRYFFD